MTASDRTLPAELVALHELPFDYDGGEGIDFEPLNDEFMSADETTSWIRAWTGNETITGDEYRVFGQDGSGGQAALWLARPGMLLLEQPIVFFGSEGELGVVARDFADYLWLLADGVGPLEAIMYGAKDRRPNAAFARFAAVHAPAAKKRGAEVIAAAQQEFPDFERRVRALTT